MEDILSPHPPVPMPAPPQPLPKPIPTPSPSLQPETSICIFMDVFESGIMHPGETL